MYFLNHFHKFSDLPLRLINYLKRIIKKSSPFSLSANKSDSEGTFYQKAVDKILSSEKEFCRFRRKFNYREILEHVDFKLGNEYFCRIQQLDANFATAKMDLTRNDSIGRPRRYRYPKFNEISPTTLRYIAVALEIEKEIDLTEITKVVEIGAGYGGQAAILDKFISNVEYYIYDLPSVQALIKKYLIKIGMKRVQYLSLDSIYQNQEFDLVISNYAFSELPKDIQIEYIEKVLLKSKSGYLIMNSGRGNITGRSHGKLTLEEITELIPGIKVKEEEPLTSPDNYVICWQNKDK